MSKYVRLTKGLNDKGVLVKPEEIQSHVNDTNTDWYTSTYYYDDNHLNLFKKTNTVKGITDVKSNKLWFDLDSSNDLELARKDATSVVERLKDNKIPEKDIEIYFSGAKGFTLQVTLNRWLTPDQIQSLAINKYGKDIKTLDLSMYNPSRIFRLPWTKHNKSGLYKIPLTYDQLKTKSIKDIKILAINPDKIEDNFQWQTVNPNEEFFKVQEEKKLIIAPTSVESEIDWTKKPRHWKDFRWSLSQGFFEPGERNKALMVLAASCRALGYDRDQTKALCAASITKQAVRFKQEPFEEGELETTILNVVFGDGFNGGQYSPKTNPWLKSYCDKMGLSTEEEKETFTSFEDLGNTFQDYAVNFENNIVKTGIEGIDNNVLFLTSTFNGILGNPGSGKTTAAIQWLENASLNGIHSAFYSLDMGKPIVYAKLVQKMEGCTLKEAMRIFREDSRRSLAIQEKIRENFKKVSINFTSGITVDILKNHIKNEEQKTGEKIKLLIIDYLECLGGPYSESTANTAYISNQMKDLANELQLCAVMLLQTQKHSTSDIADPLLSMRQIKGSSMIEQASSVILTLWRDGYNPKTVNNDKYISFAAVKNRFGSLWSDDFKWDGRRGLISELTSYERQDLKLFKEEKREQKIANEKESDSRWDG